MQVARLTFAAQRRSDRPFRISPLTIYEAKFREKLTNNFHKDFSPNLTRQDKRRDGGHPEGRAEGQVQPGRAGMETKLALELRAGLGVYAEMPERRPTNDVQAFL
jgi:hypothetical protein